MVPIALALLLILAGCSGIVNPTGTAREDPTVSWTPSPTATTGLDYPPGVSASGVDVATLVEAHRLALSRAAVTIYTQRTIRATNGSTLARITTITRSSGEKTAYRYVVGGNSPDVVSTKRANFTYWTDGRETAIRRVAANGTARYTLLSGESEAGLRLDTTGERRVFGALSGHDLTLDATEGSEGIRLFVLQSQSDRMTRPDGTEWRNIRLVVRVAKSGIVKSYRLEYETTLNGQHVVVTERFEIRNLTDTVVERPAWYEKARNSSNSGGID